MIDDWIEAVGQGFRWLLGTAHLPDKRRGALLAGTVAVVVVLVVGIGVAVAGTASKPRVATPPSTTAATGAHPTAAATLPYSVAPTTAPVPAFTTTTTTGALTAAGLATHPHSKKGRGQTAGKLLRSRNQSRVG